MRYPLFIATPAVLAPLPQGASPPAGKPVVSNERVTVRDVTLKAGTPGPIEPHTEDSVTVFLQGGTLKVRQSDGTSRLVTRKINEAVFTPKGGATGLETAGAPGPRVRPQLSAKD